MTRAKAQQADVLLFCLGGNDAMDAYLSGIKCPSPVQLASFYTRLGAVFKEVQRKLNIVMLYAHSDPTLSQWLNLYIRVSTGIRENVVFLDLQRLFTDGDLSSAQTPHPTPSGHVKIAAEIQRILNEHTGVPESGLLV